MTNLEFGMDFVAEVCLPGEGVSHIMIQMYDYVESTITDRWKEWFGEKKIGEAGWNGYISPVNGISKYKKHRI